MLKRMIVNIKRKVMRNADIQHYKSIVSREITSDMHDLRLNLDKFLNITKSVFNNCINSYDSFIPYRNRPKMSDCVIITLAITG